MSRGRQPRFHAETALEPRLDTTDIRNYFQQKVIFQIIVAEAMGSLRINNSTSNISRQYNAYIVNHIIPNI